MEKSSDAFRTISEVADDLDLPQHVLRFWETRFAQVRPLKRAGGRRYYRPADILLLKAIRKLLYDEGYTIKGVQRLLKDQGARGVRAGPTTALDLDMPDDFLSSETPDPGACDLDPGRTDHFGNENSGQSARAVSPDHDGVSLSVDPEVLRQALAVIEDCEQILDALMR